ncbi:MAG: exodeoxyribonuclease V subunit alpha, partial [Rhodococcus sp. (in: high G+C Gram-positive bacteria)]
MTSVSTALRGSGILRSFNDAGVLTAADVHVALRLGALAGEASEPVLLATALTVRAVRSGSICLDLQRLRDVTVDEESDVDPSLLPWPDLSDVLDGLAVSPLVVGSANGPLTPLKLVRTDLGELLYLDRYHLQENTVRGILDARSQSHPVVDGAKIDRALAELFIDESGAPTTPPDRQRIAAALAATHWTTVIAGGPGTGKTHTVARILALLVREHGSDVRIGLAAPTGKAAARLQESVAEQAGLLG